MASTPFKLLKFALAGALLLAGCRPTETDDAVTYRFVEVWGGPGSEPGQFREPIGIAISSDEVFVSDAGNHRIQVFDRSGALLRQIGPEIAPGDSLIRPMHIDVRGDALYVPDYLMDRVYRFTRDGAPADVFGTAGSGPGQFDAPGGVAVDAEGRLYAADFYNHRVHLLRPDGSSVRHWGVTDSSGAEAGRFTYPTDVALVPAGGFVVADAYNHRIQRFDAQGELAWVRPDDQNWADSSEGRFNVATAVTTGPEGHIFVADYFNHRIQEFTPDGQLVQVFGEKGSGPGQFERPVDLAFDEEGTLYVVDFGNDRVQTFAPAG